MPIDTQKLFIDSLALKIVSNKRHGESANGCQQATTGVILIPELVSSMQGYASLEKDC